ncbi:hypothetical protein CSA08_01445 [Candidatus Gracilibacteria bacterium]|nr:MAG: hypothetical protein CSA08_01445 [Candidatus Gracilibacteria bacterium]
MKLIKSLFIFIITILALGISNSYAAINFSVSPIKYDNIVLDPGDSITKTATLRNNGTGSVTIYTGKSDFEAKGNSGVPRFVRYSELVHPDQQISTWITIDTPQFIINPGEEKTINFQIDVPEDATPGGHYGAVFFKNPNSETSSGSGNIGINIDYGVLLLVNVTGEVISTGSVGTIVVNGGGGVKKMDDCPFGDLTRSRFDRKCIDNPFEDNHIGNENGDPELNENNDGDNEAVEDNNNGDNEGLENNESGTNNDNLNNENLENNENGTNNENLTNKDLEENNNGNNEEIGKDEEEFKIGFKIPFKNEGNTHIKLKGNIVLTDENGKQIKGVGKETIKNEYGAVIGEKVVDYIPINDSDSKVLPGTKRIFQCEWKGFPYEDRDKNGKIIMKNWNPSEYYTNMNTKKRKFLMFWERILEREQNKKINADINISYINEKGEEVKFNSAKEFYINYNEEYIGLNPYVLIPMGLLLFLIFMWSLVLMLKKRKCRKCKKKIKKDMKVCPYCGTNQNENTLLKSKKNKKSK